LEIIVHYPSTQEGKVELERRVAEVHAHAIGIYLSNLNCPMEQKDKIIDMLIKDARE
jgi:hypothetical protein